MRGIRNSDLVGAALANAIQGLAGAYGQRIVRDSRRKEFQEGWDALKSRTDTAQTLEQLPLGVSQERVGQFGVPSVDYGVMPSTQQVQRPVLSESNLPDLTRLMELDPNMMNLLLKLQPSYQVMNQEGGGYDVFESRSGVPPKWIGGRPGAQKPTTGSVDKFEAMLAKHGGDYNAALNEYYTREAALVQGRIAAQAEAQAGFPVPSTVTSETGEVVSIQTPRRGGPPKVFDTRVKAKVPGAAERVGDREVIDMANTMLSKIGEIEKDYNRGFVGGILAGGGGTLGAAKEKTGIISEREARFRNNLQTVFNLYGQAVSGKVLTANEMARLEKQIPNADMAPTVFEVALNNFASTLRRILEERRSHFGPAPANKSESKSNTDNDPLGIR